METTDPAGQVRGGYVAYREPYQVARTKEPAPYVAYPMPSGPGMTFGDFGKAIPSGPLLSPEMAPGVRVNMNQYCNNPPAGRRWMLEQVLPFADGPNLDRVQYELDDICRKREWYQRHGLTYPGGQVDAGSSPSLMTYAIAAGVGVGAGYLVGRWLKKKRRR